MELQATLRGINGTVRVGMKYITFRDIKIGEIGKQDNGYFARIQLSIATGNDRKETVIEALRKAGYKTAR